ncbi:MAG TPA: MerR family transcriptional regulator, partial [Methylomirabilota bacterium]|nr:MerR family transcriptional regulator [Methylomirabilota bacterium]
MTAFSTHEVAKILGLPDSKIRSCARAALLTPTRGPGGRLRWSFQDLLLLKTTRGLLEARVPARRIRRMLASLRRQLPGDQALSSVSIYADGRRVVAWDGTARWQPDSGQFLFSFDANAVAVPDPARLAAAAPPEPPARSAGEWFDLGCELETASPGEARHAYEQ